MELYAVTELREVLPHYGNPSGILIAKEWYYPGDKTPTKITIALDEYNGPSQVRRIPEEE